MRNRDTNLKKSLFISFVATACLAQARPTPTFDGILSWLPADTETVIGMNGPFQLPDFREDSGSNDLAPEAQARALGLGLARFKNAALADLLTTKTVALALEGSRHFRSPSKPGEVLFDACEIIVLRDSTDSTAFVKQAVRTGGRIEKIGDARITVFADGNENDLPPTVIALPRPNVVLIANNKDYLATILARMRARRTRQALPRSLPEWSRIDTSAPFWAIRHYRTTDWNQDPTSPFQKDSSFPDDKAVGIAVHLDRGGAAATVDYFSASPSARETVSSYLGLESGAQIQFSSPAPGVTEGVVPLKSAELLAHFLFGIHVMLGHAIYV